MNTSIWWIRRDLRLTDNNALEAARQAAGQVIPVFILDPALLKAPQTGEKRLAFLLAGLRQLDADLRQRGSYLVVRQGSPQMALTALMAETGAETLFAEADYTPFALRRDEAIAAELPLTLLPGFTLHHPDSIYKQDGRPYTVFTPFSKQWQQRPFPKPADVIPAPDHIRTPANIATHPLPDSPTLGTAVPFLPGEAEAQRRLRRFVEGDDAPIYRYAAGRDMVDTDGTSQLSPYLRFGMMSARQAVVSARAAWRAAADAAARQGAQVWLNELIWREFYIHILFHFPHVLSGAFRPEYDALPWRNDQKDFEAWQNGRSGFPIVDAAMRQLQETGWMHNRARMIVASFLVKDLLIDWRWGERHFMQHLVDGDPAANNGGWQWTAGTGTDAAPYFRIFNPTSQSQKFDPNGRYIRRWLPELSNVPDAYIHEPAAMPALESQRIGFQLGRDYPAPIINRKLTRPLTLAAYQQAKSVMREA
ncbi:MAG: deoxyribodipyrimidine photo-lyase [Chloroflexota bacterium]